MKEAYIIRFSESAQGTLGIFTTEGFEARVIELPWRNNRQSISCVPAGVYKVSIRQSPKYGRIYWLTDVVGRSFVLTHWGNFAGDASLGYKTHSQGCIIMGKTHGKIGGQDAVLTSKPTVRLFMEHMNYEDFKLTIIDPRVLAQVA